MTLAIGAVLWLCGLLFTAPFVDCSWVRPNYEEIERDPLARVFAGVLVVMWPAFWFVMALGALAGCCLQLREWVEGRQKRDR